MKKAMLLGTGLNRLGWEPVVAHLKQWGVVPVISQDHESLDTCELTILLGYERLLPTAALDKARLGTILFHSSDLPKGRGFAPIYNTMVRNLPLVQTMLYASEKADLGPIIAKARYPLDGTETEDEVRHYDDNLTLMLLGRCLPDLVRGRVNGCTQDEGAASWWPRRSPDDSRIAPAKTILSVFDHMRALPESAPAFFDHRGRRFAIRVEAMDEPIPFDREKVVLETMYSENP